MHLELVTIEQSENADILRRRSEDISFPLTPKIIDLIEAMKQKVEELKAAGLAACQVGYPLRLIIYHVSLEAKTVRADVTEVVPITVLINPSYTPVESEGKFLDWEGCFSVTERMGKVPRYRCIQYEGFTPEGEKISKTARGFLARLLQHEIDHTNGTLMIDVMTPDCLQGHPSEMIPLRKKEIEERLANTAQS